MPYRALGLNAFSVLLTFFLNALEVLFHKDMSMVRNSLTPPIGIAN